VVPTGREHDAKTYGGSAYWKDFYSERYGAALGFRELCGKTRGDIG
jgi:hypothetical protein